MIDNQQKQENYRTQFGRLSRAIKSEFFLEAIFIEYAIMEDRIESILAYEGNTIVPKNEKEFVSIKRKINRIIKLAENKKNVYIRRYFNNDLLQRCSDWIVRRNGLIHALLKQHVTSEEIREFSEQGRMLCGELRNKTTNYKRMLERKGT